MWKDCQRREIVLPLSWVKTLDYVKAESVTSYGKTRTELWQPMFTLAQPPPRPSRYLYQQHEQLNKTIARIYRHIEQYFPISILNNDLQRSSYYCSSYLRALTSEAAGISIRGRVGTYTLGSKCSNNLTRATFLNFERQQPYQTLLNRRLIVLMSPVVPK